MKTITLKYPGKCRDCGRKMVAGELARWHGRGKISCAESDDEDYIERELKRRENARYEQGKAEATQYLNDVATYGRDLAEQWEMEAEMGRYNRGED